MNTKNYSTHTRKYKQILSAVHMVYRLVNSTYNVQELILRLTRLLCQFIKADSSAIYILGSKKGKVKFKAIFNNKFNILISKQKLLSDVTSKERKVLNGFAVFEDKLIGIPLVAEDNIGAIFIKRKKTDAAFNEFDKDMLSVVVEQSVTAIKNLQLYEEQQKVILGSIEFIGKLLKMHGHSFSMTHAPVYFKIVSAVAQELNMRQESIDNLYYASVLRGAGAIDVPYEILSKTSQLTPEEFKVIQQQPKRSAELIRPVEFLKPVLPIILYHHEKYDGTGYPSGLKKEQIPLGARILAVVDAFEAMVGERPYKERLTTSEAIEDIKKNSGTQFDPLVVNAFVKLSKQKYFRKYLSLTRHK